MTDQLANRILSLTCWRTKVTLTPLKGGLSNVSFLVDDGPDRYVARCGDDIPAHHVFREHERMVSQAAFAAGLSPELVHSEPGIMVFRYVDGRTWTDADMRANIGPIARLLTGVHRDLGRRIIGPGRCFWVFHVLRDYATTLRSGESRHLPAVLPFLGLIDRLEDRQVAMPFVFAHHDLLPGNFIQDGNRIWLIDWEYGAFGTPLFDLANVATNAGFDEADVAALLQAYFGDTADERLRCAFDAMAIASTLREAMWAMVSELHLATPGIDYGAHAADYLARTGQAVASFRERYGAP